MAPFLDMEGLGWSVYVPVCLLYSISVNLNAYWN